MISPGVFITSSSGRAVTTAKTVMTKVLPTHSRMEVATLSRSRSSSPAPKHWAAITEKPLVSPWAKPRIKKDMAPVAPTAAKACTPMVRPTITVSAML